MGTGEQSTPVRPSKPTSTNQESLATSSYPDWSSSMQAYYAPGAAPPFFASTVASPSPHPYLWGNQHPLMPPYGTPVPYPALYPPAGVYAHPNMAMAPGPLQPMVESDAKAPEGKDRTTNKKFKGASKAGESGKAASGSGNDGATQSAESGSEGSSDGSDENNNHDHSVSKKGSFDQMLADGASAQNNTAVGNFQASVPGNPVVSVPATNLNIGMDLWNPSSAASGTIKMRPGPGVSPAAAPGMMGDQWIQV